MGTVSQFPTSETCRDGQREGGELVALRHLDLETIVETVRALRTLEDQSVLDCFNRADRVRA